MEYQELIERLRYEGYDVSRNEAANAIESLLAENERLKHNLAVTEQTMREYQELAAKRLEEIAKYRDAPVVAWREFDGEGGYDYCSYDDNEDFQSEYRKRNPRKIYHDWVQPLIVKPGE